MALGIPEQVAQAVNRSRQLLVTFPADHPLDAVASAFALTLVLRQLGRIVDVAAAGFTEAARPKFLPELNVAPELNELQQLEIAVKLRQASLAQLSYDVSGDTLAIHLSPRQGRFTPQDVSATVTGYRYDLIICVGCVDLMAVGDLYHRHRDFFERTTVVNVDHHPANEHYGQINAVDLTAAATAEVVYDLLPALLSTPAGGGPPSLDAGVATALLAGFIDRTRSFRSSKVTAKTLRAASALVSAGGNREAIVRALYQSRSVAALKLWGRTLSRLQSDLNGRLIWASVTETDFLEAGATAADLPGLTDALIAALPNAEVVVFLTQRGGTVAVTLASLKHLHALQLCRPFPAHGDRQAAAWEVAEKSLPEAEAEVIAAVRENFTALTA